MEELSLDNLLDKKKEAKKELSKKLSFSFKRPLLGIFIDKELSKKDEEKIKNILEGTANINMEVIVLADSNIDAFPIPHVIFLPYSRPNRKTLLEAADMTLLLPLNDSEEFLLNGVVPVAEEKTGLSDYNPNHETGNGFIYKNDNQWSIFAALVRAMETFKFPYDWRNIVSEGIKSTQD